MWTPQLDTTLADGLSYPNVQASRANRVSLPQARRRRQTRRPPPPDLPSILYDQRIVYLGMPLVPAVTELIVAELLHLEKEGPRLPVEMLINSTGTTRADGETLALDGEGLAVLTTMGFVRTPIETVNIGVAVGWAAVILANGRKGKRKSFPHALTMLQQPRQPPTGQRQAIEVHVKWREVLGFKQDLLRALSYGTGWAVDKLDRDIQRALYMAPEDCLAYNVIDEVIQPDTDKLLRNELKWRKSGRLEDASRIAGWQREFELSMESLRKKDELDYLRESARETQEEMVRGMGIPYKERVAGSLPPEFREKLDQGKIPMTKAGIDILLRESERVKARVFERRAVEGQLPEELAKEAAAMGEQLEAKRRAAGEPVHGGEGLDVDYQGLVAELDSLDASQLQSLDLDALVKRHVKGVRGSSQ